VGTLHDHERIDVAVKSKVNGVLYTTTRRSDDALDRIASKRKNNGQKPPHEVVVAREA